MADVLANSRAFQEQWFVFGASKVSSKRHLNRAGQPRYFKRVGLGFTTPKAATEGTYVDKKCPWTSNVSIRGRLTRGLVTGTQMQRTVSCRRNYLKYVAKYQRYEKRHSKFSAHLTPAIEVKKGDEVILGQCRPLSKTVKFEVLKVNPKTREASKQKKHQPTPKVFKKH